MVYIYWLVIVGDSSYMSSAALVCIWCKRNHLTPQTYRNTWMHKGGCASELFSLAKVQQFSTTFKHLLVTISVKRCNTSVIWKIILTWKKTLLVRFYHRFAHQAVIKKWRRYTVLTVIISTVYTGSLSCYCCRQMNFLDLFRWSTVTLVGWMSMLTHIAPSSSTWNWSSEGHLVIYRLQQAGWDSLSSHTQTTGGHNVCVIFGWDSSCTDSLSPGPQRKTLKWCFH
jgi:hypothetical protein